jgi:hypothetical protein
MMEVERDDSRGLVKSTLRRGASPLEGRHVHRENLGAATSGASTAAHARAVMTVRLTLLLLIIGVALFLFTGPGGALPLGSERGDPVERLK